VQKRYAKYWAFSHLVAALGHGGSRRDAEKAVTELRARKPDFGVSFAKEHLYDYRDPANLDHYLQGLGNAGLPDD
jgi:creatinine amidohydrolase/Fe(II)-dependent formamide hydrolase-like protein